MSLCEQERHGVNSIKIGADVSGEVDNLIEMFKRESRSNSLVNIGLTVGQTPTENVEAEKNSEVEEVNRKIAEDVAWVAILASDDHIVRSEN